MPIAPPPRTIPPYVVLVFQGGGARAAYQVGVYEGLREAGYEAQMVSGISSGALNAALIACNEPATRVPRLRAFWDAIAAPIDLGRGLPAAAARLARAAGTLGGVLGQRNFYAMRPRPPFLAYPGTPEATSIYSTEPLHDTLEGLCDFDGYETAPLRDVTRLCLGVVDVELGKLEFFDSADERMRITARHVMASGALPPGAPAVRIGGREFWDGGVAANSPLEPILESIVRAPDGPPALLVVVVDLWTAEAPRPRTLGEVYWREQQIRYQSRTEHALRAFATEVELDAASLLLQAATRSEEPRFPRVSILHLNHGNGEDLVPFGPLDFTRGTIGRRIEAGREHVVTALASDWQDDLYDGPPGVVVHRWVEGRRVSRTTKLHLPWTEMAILGGWGGGEPL